MLTQNALRKPLILLASAIASLGVSACGMDGSQSFEAVAERIAAIPLDGDARPDASATPYQAGLRPADAPLRVAVMEPHAMWDARDGLIEASAASVAPRIAEAVTDAVVGETQTRMQRAMPGGGLRPATAPLERPGSNASRLVQLGAYSSRAAAEAAWARHADGEGRRALGSLTPVYEPVEVAGRQLVRLKVRASASSAAAVCAAARIDDPWCRQG